MSLRVSIITPSFKQLEWLKLAAASVADQSGVEVEHIVQDAGSGSELNEWASTQSFRLFVESDNGMYDAVNRGLRRASGDILAYLNCDEQYLPGTLNAVSEFFEHNPEVDVIFGNVIVTDATGNYICSREVLTPLKYHTWVCSLGVFTAATFFRRRVIDEHKIFFDERWRDLGDAVWILELLKRKVRMAKLARFTTAFADTGQNMNLRPNAIFESQQLRSSAPAWVGYLSPIWSAQHRVRKLVHGLYWPKKLAYSVFTAESPETRRTFVVDAPRFKWR